MSKSPYDPPPISDAELERAIELQARAKKELDARERDEKRAAAGLITRATAGAYTPSEGFAVIHYASRHEDCDCDRFALPQTFWLQPGLATEFRPGCRLSTQMRRLRDEEARTIPTVETILRVRSLKGALANRTRAGEEVERDISSAEQKIEILKREISNSRETARKLEKEATAARVELENFTNGFSKEFLATVESAAPLSNQPPIPVTAPDYSRPGSTRPGASSGTVYEKLAGGGVAVRRREQ